MRDQTTEPAWPTTTRSRLSGGRLLGTDGSLWMYRRVPMGPVVDAASPEAGYSVAEPILAAMDEMSSIAVTRITRRAASRSAYRRVHLLLVNIPRYYRPDPTHPNAEFLETSYPEQAVDHRVLLFGVKLIDRIGGTGGFKAAVSSVAETLASGMTPVSDFDDDYSRVDAALARSGLVMPKTDEFRLLDAWWNHGRYPDTPLLIHGDHTHVFADSVAAAAASGLDPDVCRDWPEIPGHYSLTLAAVQDFDLPFVTAIDPLAHWASSLVANGAKAISIRGLVEPARITRNELRRQRKRNLEDINEFANAGKMERSEQTERGEQLESIEGSYALGGVPTLIDASVVVALDGQVDDITQLGIRTGLTLHKMDFRQQPAMFEMMMCSPVRANPHLQDLPSTVIACSGIASLSTVGDRDGALIGFTESDRQPAYLSPTAASTADGLPIFLGVGQTGSGKTLLMLMLADQYARAGSPVVIVDPKTGSSHDAAVTASGGQVISLDSLAGADGVFDPFRFAIDTEAAIDMASSMLLSVNPWGDRRANYEAPLALALRFGKDAGATCMGEALQFALAAGKAEKRMVEDVTNLAESSPMFRACFGVEPSTTALRLAKGITLVKVGNAHLDLPEPGVPVSEMSLQQRVALSLVRMMVFGSAMAMTGRQGVVMLDEAWVFLGAGRSEVERLGRLARSQGVLPMLFTQRVTDALEAGLSGYISRGFILPITDVAEAVAACHLFKLEATDERLRRLTARATRGTAAEDGTAPNWDSMRALRDPETGAVVRGSIGIYADLLGRAVPVEVKVPPAFLAIASTNPDDIRQRHAEELASTEALLALEAGDGTSAVESV